MDSEKKNRCREALDIIFAKALAERVFPGAAVAVSTVENNWKYDTLSACYGTTDFRLGVYPVTTETIFDLASLTKPLVTVLLLLSLIEEKRISVTDDLSVLLPGVNIPVDKRGIQLGQLMSHCSGFPAHRNYYTSLLTMVHQQRKSWLMESILGEDLAYSPGKQHVYSDLGFILLGMIIEEITGRGLADSFQTTLAEPLEIEDQLFFPGHSKRTLTHSNCMVTETCPWSKVVLCGRVHDDNCRALGGVAGHAGLFGTLKGVVTLCGQIYDCYHGKNNSLPMSSQILRMATGRVGRSTWSMGFDTPSALYSSSGKFFGSTSIGHLGFTGTSFWIDLEKGISVVLLSNRVCPTRANEKIKRFRPKLHNLIMEELGMVGVG